MAKRANPKACRSWIVRLRRIVEVDVTCENCTRKEAERNYAAYAVSETELETIVENVLDVRPNK